MELVHASSLILDDLPSMDDAPLRRGRPANHLEFGEAIAILAAFGLLNLAYGTLARAYEPPLAARLCALVADAVGPDGLIGGQAADLLATDSRSASRCSSGSIAARPARSSARPPTCRRADRRAPTADAIASLAAYAKNLGLAFQIVDDLLDVEGDPADTGKAVRADAKKTTFVSFSGVDGRAPARDGAVPDRRSRAGAVRPARGSPARRCRRSSRPEAGNV